MRDRIIQGERENGVVAEHLLVLNLVSDFKCNGRAQSNRFLISRLNKDYVADPVETVLAVWAKPDSNYRVKGRKPVRGRGKVLVRIGA